MSGLTMIYPFQNPNNPPRKMSSRRMKVSKCPSDTLTMTNRAIVNPRDFDKQVSPVLPAELGYAIISSHVPTSTWGPDRASTSSSPSRRTRTSAPALWPSLYPRGSGPLSPSIRWGGKLDFEKFHESIILLGKLKIKMYLLMPRLCKYLMVVNTFYLG